MTLPWWQTFFDADYLRIWEHGNIARPADVEVEALWSVLGASAGIRILDAPCGYGRIARPLAERGASVLGVDFSADLLEEAERRREGMPLENLRYRRHDLRAPLDESTFDVALNIFSSLGYGTESEDRAILSTLHAALRPGGSLFLETNHRDAALFTRSRNPTPARRLPDGTLLLEEAHFDAISGRIDTTWYFSGPAGSGQKTASLRIYSATELVSLLTSSGFQHIATYEGCSTAPFRSDPTRPSTRLGLLATRL